MQIEQIAKEAHNELVTKVYAGHTEPFTPWLLEFAKLVAAKERERIVILLKSLGTNTNEDGGEDEPTRDDCIFVIKGEA